jgi:hypothetical protein
VTTLRNLASVTPDLSIVRDLQVVPETPAATRHGMALLAAGVPLSLLFDLADPQGPPSADMMSSESNGHDLIRDLLAFRSDTADRAGSRTRRAVGDLSIG